MAYLTNNKITFLLVFALSLLFFMQGLNIHGIEYRDDEIFYFNSTREMLETENLLSPVYFGENRFQKPILFYWMILFFYKIFGSVSWFAARFTSVVTASLTVALTWVMAQELFNKKIATISAVVLATLPMFFRHAKNAVPDMTLNFFVVLAVYFILKFFKNPTKRIYSYLFFAACALGFMIKGFAAVVIPFLILIVYAIIKRQTAILAKINFPLGILILLIIILPWFLYMASLHGESYFEYMLGVETLNRTVAQGEGNIFLKLISTIKNNSLFYLQTIMSYFAPWSIFIFGAIPLAFYNLKRSEDKNESLLIMLVWFFVVFAFFALIFHRINHLILVLTTPFAILVSYFFLEGFKGRSACDRIIKGLRKYIALFIITSGLIGISFVKVFLVGSSRLWLLAFLVFFLLSLMVIIKERDHILVPAVLGLLLLFSFSQAPLLSKARLTSISALQEFAYVIHGDMKGTSIIGVGSHDIHEKEFQIYFNQKINKVATSDDDQTKEMLMDFFAKAPSAYCLITRKDYNEFLGDSLRGQVSIIQKDYMFRRRINIDNDFFAALLKLDQKKIKNYFLEEIFLIKKERRG